MNSGKCRVLVLDTPAATGITLQVVQCLAHSGRYRIHVASPLGRSIIRRSRLIEGFHDLGKPGTPEEQIDGIKRAVSKSGASLVLPANIDQIGLLISHADEELRRLVVPQPAEAPFRKAVNKANLAVFLKEHQLPLPRSEVFTSFRSADLDRLEAFRPPVLLKPSWGAGGRGISICATREELTIKLKESARESNPMIVQEYIEGHDVSSAVFCLNGKVLHSTIQRNVAPARNCFVPSRGLKFIEHPRVAEITAELMAKLGWSGIAQVDFRIKEPTGEVFVLEINPRYWGSLLGSRKMGVNFPHISCQVALGRTPEAVPPRLGKYISAFGYLKHLQDCGKRKSGADCDFSLKDTAFDEILHDPLPRCVELVERLLGKLRPKSRRQQRE